MYINDFIKYLKDHKDQYRNYLEIIISPLGKVYLATPCHQEALVIIGALINKVSVKEYKQSIPKYCSPIHWVVSKEKYISVWYDHIIIPENKITRFQRRVLQILQREGFLSKTIKEEKTNEYQRYLKRKELYGD